MTLKRIIPRPVFVLLQPAYHFCLALAAALWFRFPARKLRVVAITGTKGKTTTTELIAAMLREGGERVALSNTVHFIWGEEEERNLYKMSMPGRFFMQWFLHRAVRQGCGTAVIEMTSEGARLFRHRFTFPDALVFTNLAPEHIESHGSFEAYRDAKLRIRDELARSPKKSKVVVTNADDAHGELFARVPGARVLRYSLNDALPIEEHRAGTNWMLTGKRVSSPLLGRFNILNSLAASLCAGALGVAQEAIVRAVENTRTIPGRAEFIKAGQAFDVIVDYAHTPESLIALYESCKDRRSICVLGSCGGGRDTWKRPAMGAIADSYCAHIILTNEDPYDEDPMQIIEDVAKGLKAHTPEIILDRREAIQRAIAHANEDDVIFITGKGTDPYLMGPKDSKMEWSDAEVAREELMKLKS